MSNTLNGILERKNDRYLPDLSYHFAYIITNIARLFGEQYCICYAAFNATAVALSAVGSVPKSDPTADSATAVALITLLHAEYCSPRVDMKELVN